MLCVPGDPSRRTEHELVQQVLLAECRDTDDVDALDLGDIAFLDGEVDPHPVTLERRDGSLQVHAVEAARKVLALELLLGLIQQGAVENTRLGKAEFTEAAAQPLGFEFLDTGEIDLGNGGTLLRQHHKHPVFDLQPHIAEEPGGEQRADRLLRLFLGHGFADLDRQVAEDCPGLGTLQPLHPDVLDREWVEGERLATQEEAKEACSKGKSEGLAIHSDGK